MTAEATDGGGGAVLVRRYEDADADAVWDLHNRALAESGAHAGNGPWDRDLRAVSETYLARDGEFLVATESGRLVGMGALVRVDEATGEIKRMRVDPARQRAGVGSALLRELETAAAERGLRRLVLDTTTLQTSALAFYVRHGYLETHRAQRGPFTLVFFEKTLGRG